ncbi:MULTISPECIES: manganese efflux pump [unclassified Mucilaginibacter]|uniref:manganese efflux pump n=1 Tax=unclassified Mucilaginibacter TaxID=2617802 RepID=UPI000964A505|nr:MULTISPECIES: manganese efflux pump [unclassified Mucilaginibacter]OJW18190.1 MAG: hypothetical protein BGO48_16655 [Mucilaginibacter sp. 44-25]PLW89541.1 MAG: hypothetical protein C0154_10995 [Mucilaginibacter sp.]HEK19433.1 hypothetical protein [Bacteroidota bacterium]
MIIVYNLALIGISAGLAADNLMLAFHNGNYTKINRQLPELKRNQRYVSPNWIIVLVLLFLMENMVLIYGIEFGEFTCFLLKNNEEIIAIGILFGMGIRMFHEAKIKNRVSVLSALNTRRCIEIILGTSIYIFAFGCAMAWLKIDYHKINLIVSPLLIVTYLSGIVLGRYQFNKTFRYLNTISALMIIAGSLLLTLQHLKNIL